MVPLEKNGQRFLRYWGTLQWQLNQHRLDPASKQTFCEIIQGGYRWEQPFPSNDNPLSMEDIKQVDLILKTFQEVRFRIIEAYYAKGFTEQMIAESLQNPTSSSTVNRWLKSSNHEVGSAMASLKLELC